jgi:hypothetical protein
MLFHFIVFFFFKALKGVKSVTRAVIKPAQALQEAVTRRD